MQGRGDAMGGWYKGAKALTPRRVGLRRGIYRFFVGDDGRMGWHGQNLKAASL